MAKQVKNTDIFEANLFKKTQEDVKALITEIDNLEGKLVLVAKQQKEILSQQDNKTIQSIQRTKIAVDKLNEAEKLTNNIRNQKIKLEQNLKQARKVAISENEQLKLLLAEQNKINKQLAREKLGLVGAYEKESKRLILLRKQYKDLALAEGETSVKAKQLLTDITALDSKLKQVDATVGQSQRNVGNYSSAWSRLGSTFKAGLGLLGITAGLAGIVSLMKNSIKIFTDFEAANSNLKAVLGANEQQMKSLSDNAKILGASTSFTASQVTGLQISFAKLGFPTEEILNMTESTLNAAAAMGSGLDETAALTGATLKAFGLTSKDAARVNDVLAKSTSASALDFSKLQNAMSTIAPVANSFGFGVEETTALLGQLSNAGFDASSSATATRNILLNLADSNGKLAKSLKEPVKDLPSLVRGLKQLKGEGIDLGKALDLTDKRSVAAFSTFLEGTDDILDLNNALLKAGGTAKRMADTQLDNLQGKTKILNSAWEGLVLSVLDGDGAFTKVAQSVVEVATGFVEWLTVTESLSDELQKQADSLITITVALNDVNTNTSTRLDLIQSLNATYPELIKNLGFEKAGLENVNEVLAAVNKNMLERVNIQKAVEETTQQNNNTTSSAEIRQKALAKFVFQGTKNLQENGLANLLVGKSLEEQSQIISENQTFWQGFTNELKSVENATALVNGTTKESNEIFKQNREFVLSTIKSRKDLENLTTEELRALAKSNLLKGLRLQLDLKEIIILRERVAVTNEETKATNESSDAIDKKTKKTRTLTGLIEKQAKAVSDVNEKIQRATSEEQIITLRLDLEVEQDELKRLKRIVSSTLEELQTIELDLIEDTTQKAIAKEEEKSRKLIEKIRSNSTDSEALKKKLIEQEQKRLADFTEDLQIKELQQSIKTDEEFAKAEIEQRRTGFKTQEEFEKFKAEQFLAIKKHALEEELNVLEFSQRDEDKLRVEQLKAQLAGLNELGKGTEDLQKAFSQAIEVIGDVVDDAFEKRLERIDKALEKTGERIEQLRSKANEGQLASQESLAFEQKREAELEKQRAREQKRQQKVQALFTVLSTFQANVNSGASNPLAKTFADVAVLKSLAGTLGSAYDGVDDTGDRGKVDSKGGKLWVLHPNEQVWSKKDRNDVGFRDRNEIKDIVKMYDNGMLDNLSKMDNSSNFINPSAFVVNGLDSNIVVNKLDQLNRTLKQMEIPKGMVNIDEVRKLITLTTKKGNQITKERSKLHS